MMTRRQRLMATLRGLPVDRPAVCFYEIDGSSQNPADSDPYNIFSDPSWRPALELAAGHTDRIVRRGVWAGPLDPIRQFARVQTHEENGSRFTETTLEAGGRILRRVTRRDRDIDTVWTIEHLLKDVEDLKAFLDLPWPEVRGPVDVSRVLAAEAELGEGGIVMLDTGDPLCLGASLFAMADYTVVALTEPELFTQLLDPYAQGLLAKTRLVAEAAPGRLWRIYGPEYATPPYLPPRLFARYVTPYVSEMVRIIHGSGGFARIHCHGRLKDVLDQIVATGAMGLDPVEPPPQGDVELGWVRKHYGEQLVLFGNLEASDLENLPTEQFRQRIRRALAEGTAGPGRGFVLMPSACPYGRKLPPLALANYRAMVEEVEGTSAGGRDVQ